MSKPTDTTEFLQELNGGAFASQIGHALSEVAAGVVDHGKAGKLTITLDFSQIGNRNNAGRRGSSRTNRRRHLITTASTTIYRLRPFRTSPVRSDEAPAAGSPVSLLPRPRLPRQQPVTRCPALWLDDRGLRLVACRLA